MRILLAEDERALSKAIVRLLEKNNCSADAVFDGEEALDYLETGNYDALVLDLMMPRMDGITVLKKLRASGNPIPVLILTAKAEVDDKVLGLDSGADYYLTKPFDGRELLAALRAITRPRPDDDRRLSFGNITLDRAAFTLSSPNGSFRLVGKEFQVLEMLLCERGSLISTERFMEKIWGFDSETEIQVVWVYISYLRKKLAALEANVEIKAYRSAGYALEEKA